MLLLFGLGESVIDLYPFLKTDGGCTEDSCINYFIFGTKEGDAQSVSLAALGASLFESGVFLNWKLLVGIPRTRGLYMYVYIRYFLIETTHGIPKFSFIHETFY